MHGPNTSCNSQKILHELEHSNSRIILGRGAQALGLTGKCHPENCRLSLAVISEPAGKPGSHLSSLKLLDPRQVPVITFGICRRQVGHVSTVVDPHFGQECFGF